MPRHDKPLRFFVDRSLGRGQVPDGLRRLGLDVVTLAERYGIPDDEGISDETWLSDAGRNGEIVLTKDYRIKTRPAELDAIKRNRVKCFCISSARIGADEMIQRFQTNLQRMIRASRASGPFLYVVHSKSIEKREL